jgi:hypothetical protein
MNALEQNAGLIDLVCNEDVKNTIFELCFFIRQCPAEIINGRTDVFRQSRKSLGNGFDAAISAMRSEMGIEKAANAAA